MKRGLWLSLTGCGLTSFVFFVYGFSRTRITVTNATQQVMAIATYKVEEGGGAFRHDGPLRVQPGTTIRIARPSFTFGFNSELVAVPAYDKKKLTQIIPRSVLQNYFSHNIGRLKGWNFVVHEKNGRLAMKSSFKKNVAQIVALTLYMPFFAKEQAKVFAYWPFKKIICSKQPAIITNPYVQAKAAVREGNELSLQEKRYISNRKKIVKKALDAHVEQPLASDEVPTVVLCCSGGGYRALLGTVGSLAAAHEADLLPMVSYTVGLSGSTWALGMWYATGCSLEQLPRMVVDHVTKNIYELSVQETRKIIDALLVKWAFDQQVTLVDFYGGILANRLLQDAGNARQRVHLSEQAARFGDGQMPLPIYTAVSGKEVPYLSRIWYEYTPFEIGSAHFGRYIPAWAYGRTFYNGVSTDYAPEQSFGYLLGTFGSAFAVTVERVLKELMGARGDRLLKEIRKDYAGIDFSIVYQVITERLLSNLLRARISAGKINNFMFGNGDSAVREKQDLSFVDAGLAFNLPYPPISGQRPERMADVIIFLDNSATVHDAPELRKVAAYAKKFGLKFPKITYEGIGERLCSIFNDESDVTIPTVIYMPRCLDKQMIAQAREGDRHADIRARIASFNPDTCVTKSFCNTFNFSYSADQARRYISLTKFNMLMAAQQIKEAIIDRIMLTRNVKIKRAGKA